MIPLLMAIAAVSPWGTSAALVETCRDPAPSAQGICLGFISGILDGERTMAQISAEMHRTQRDDAWCFPAGLDNRQVADRILYDLSLRLAKPNAASDPITQSASLSIMRAATTEFNCIGVSPDQADPARR